MSRNKEVKPPVARDGAPDEHVGHRVNVPGLLEYCDDREHMANFQVARLVRASCPSERLYVAAFDGTGNYKSRQPTHPSNVSQIAMQIHNAARTEMHASCLDGPGMQFNRLVGFVDNATGFTYLRGIKQMYADLVKTAQQWFYDDPASKINVLTLGFHRSACQAAAFTSYIDQRGIPDMTSRLSRLDQPPVYSRYLAGPGSFPQAIGLFAPVVTGGSERHRRNLPPSMVSGFQIIAGNEERAMRPLNLILDPGHSADGRFLSVVMPGSYTDIGGGYLRHGLARRCHNLMVAFCNTLRDEPFLEYLTVPLDRRYNVIHSTTDGVLDYLLTTRLAR